LQHAAVVASPDVKLGEDLFASVADLAKRKGQNAIRPDIIRIPLSGLKDITPLAEELKRRSEEEDPSAGKSALGLLVDAGNDFTEASKAAPQLTGIGAIKLQLFAYNDVDWRAYEECVQSALAAHVPLWLEVGGTAGLHDQLEDLLEGAEFKEVTVLLELASRAHALGHRGLVLSLQAFGMTPSYLVRAYRLLSSKLTEARRKYPIHISSFTNYVTGDVMPDEWLIDHSIEVGSLLCDGIGNSIEVGGDGTADDRVALAFNILQASGSRTIKAEFVACPSCGRTLFDLQETTERIKQATGHLRGVKIAVMGCIVNGLGELADADFGYMGGAPGKVNLFVGKECVEKGVPTDDAVRRLIDIIKTHGKWTEPTVRT
jgi:4-hydroxy-3-methylbut-2-en-1-yl diphosphate synthase IspG/GcpE